MNHLVSLKTFRCIDVIHVRHVLTTAQRLERSIAQSRCSNAVQHRRRPRRIANDDPPTPPHLPLMAAILLAPQIVTTLGSTSAQQPPQHNQ